MARAAAARTLARAPSTASLARRSVPPVRRVGCLLALTAAAWACGGATPDLPGGVARCEAAALISALGHEKARIRAEGARAAARCETAAIRERLAELAADPRERAWVRVEAITALAALGAGLETLARVGSDRGADVDVRLAVVAALERFGTASACAALADLSGVDDVLIRARAETARARRCDEESPWPG